MSLFLAGSCLAATISLAFWLGDSSGGSSGMKEHLDIRDLRRRLRSSGSHGVRTDPARMCTSTSSSTLLPLLGCPMRCVLLGRFRGTAGSSCSAGFQIQT